MSEELQQKLRSQLWTVANTLRGNMSASDFMYFTLGFIFYKYLSEKIELYANEILEEDHITFKEVWNGKDEELKQDVKEECIQNLGYFIEPEYLYSTIIELISKKENILPSLERSLKKIEDSTIGQDSEDDFGGLFSDLDLASPKLGKTADDKNKLISDVLIALNGIDFGLQEAGDIDILGDAYEYMISQFAAGAGKKAGEFYTPQEVSQILAEIVITGKVRLKDVFDPTCGSGSLLLRTAKSGKADSIFGQEKNPTTFNLCRMNMLLHGVKYNDFDIQNGDTLEADAFGDRQFDAVVANPPFSADWTAADKFNKRVIKALAPNGVKVNVYGTEKGADILQRDSKDPNERVMILTKTPITYDRMADMELKLSDVNLGGMGLRGERTPFIKNVACSPDEITSIKNLRAKGVHVYYQLVPEQQVIEVDGYLNE